MRFVSQHFVLKNCNKSEFQDRPEDFFSHLGKESEGLPIVGVATAASIAATAELLDPLQVFSANVTMCSQHPVLLNNVSLSEAVQMNAANGWLIS